jgi:hypothetical protein
MTAEEATRTGSVDVYERPEIRRQVFDTSSASLICHLGAG